MSVRATLAAGAIAAPGSALPCARGAALTSPPARPPWTTDAGRVVRLGADVCLDGSPDPRVARAIAGADDPAGDLNASGTPGGHAEPSRVGERRRRRL